MFLVEPILQLHWNRVLWQTFHRRFFESLRIVIFSGHLRLTASMVYIKPIQVNVMFFYTMKISENYWLSDAFRAYKNGTLSWNGLIWNSKGAVNPLSANPTKWSNTRKQFVGCCRQIVWMGMTILWGWRL